MSLTNHLDDRKSPIRRFLRNQFPNTRTFLANPRKQLRGACNIGPKTRDQYPWSTVGVALDYRIRYYFAVTPITELVAYRGAELLSGTQVDNTAGRRLAARRTGRKITIVDLGTGQPVGVYLPDRNGAVTLDEGVSILEIMELGRKAAEGSVEAHHDSAPQLGNRFGDFFSRLYALTERNSPVATRLTRCEEDELNRYCFVLAQFEEVARTGRADGMSAEGDCLDAESLIDLAKPHWIDDLTELSWRFYDRFNHLLGLPHVLNPRFDGSAAVGGADADMIVGGTLIEIKTTIRREIPSNWIWQLLGYTLLDYSDLHHTNGVGLYMARQGLLIEWDLEEAIRELTSGESTNIGRLRAQFKELM